jgi:hypothetical protein
MIEVDLGLIYHIPILYLSYHPNHSNLVVNCIGVVIWRFCFKWVYDELYPGYDKLYLIFVLVVFFVVQTLS